MPQKKLRYFELKPHIGENPEDPLQSQSLEIAVPTMVGNEVVDLGANVVIAPAGELAAGDDARIVPNTRVIEVRNYLIAGVLSQHPNYVEIDKPSASQIGSQRANATERKREQSTTTAKEQ